MTNIPLNHVFLLAAVLFCLGLTGVLTRRNILFILMSLEIMVNAAGLAMVTAGLCWLQPDGQVVFIFVLTMAAAEVSVGLALVLQMYHRYQSLDTNLLQQLKG